MTDTPAEPQRITAADVTKLRFVAEPALHPDGRRVVYSVAHSDEDENTYRAHLWLVAADGTGKPRQFTHGSGRDGGPVWSPDGQWLAFTRTRSGHREVWLLPADGGEARRLTHTPHGAGDPVWAPDSRTLAFTTAVGPDDPAPAAEPFETDDAHKKRKEAAAKARKEEPQRITRLRFKHDGDGYWPGRYTHIWLQDLDEEGDSVGEPRQVTVGDYEDSAPAWSPDGQWLAFSTNRRAEPDLDLGTDLFVVPAAGGALQQITGGTGIAGQPAWSPDGTRLAYIGHERGPEWGFGSNNILYVVPFRPGAATSSARIDLSGHLDRPVDNMVLSDSKLGGGVNLPVWTPDGTAILMLLSSWGRCSLYRFAADGQAVPLEVIGGDREVFNPTYTPDGRRVAYTVSTPTHPRDIFAADLAADGSLSIERRLTEVNQALFAERPPCPAEEIRFDGPDGTALQGWIIKPPGFATGRKYPAVLCIHGGPHLMYGFSFFHEFQLLAGEGYVVFYMNPRGGQGYGQAFSDALRGDWGAVAHDDLMRGVDRLLDTGYVDADRLAVSGGSYGGYMALWIIGHTARFRTAVASRSVTNLISMYGSSDAGWVLEDWEFLPLFARPDAYQTLWQHSPLAYAPQVETPVLLTHGADDLRCHLEQAEEMHVALKRLGKVSELVYFPGASHELSRAGAPKMRVGRLDAITEWLGRYLKEEPVHD